jgi:hypothetical protein
MPDDTADTNGREGTGRQDAEPHSTTGDEQEPEGAVPPGYDWPTHGGYLGCLLGLLAACVVGGFIGSSLDKAIQWYNWAPGVVSALIVVAVYVVAIGALCALGWTLGKRFYRAYPQSRGRTWGEHDDADGQVDLGNHDLVALGDQRGQDEQDGAVERADGGTDDAGDVSKVSEVSEVSDAGVAGAIMGAQGREMPASARASATEALRGDSDERAERDGKR